MGRYSKQKAVVEAEGQPTARFERHAGVTYRINRLEGSCRPLRVRAVTLSLAYCYLDDLSL
jgi:hypothetical protein